MTTGPDVESLLGADLAASVPPIPFTDTVLSIGNLVTSGGLLLLVPLLCYLLAPKESEHATGIEAFDVDEEEAPGESTPETMAEKISHSPLTLVLVVPALLYAVVLFFVDAGVSALDPNAINLIFLTLGLILHGSLFRYAKAIGDASKHATGIVLQFPFYAGIMGVMRTTGLAATFSASLTSLAPAKLYTAMTFLSAGVVNLFVPSGGGQWAVQGPIAVRAATDLGIPVEQVVMAVAYGDQWTNMLQPFWALPLLAITGVKARHVLGYTTIFLIVGGLWMFGSLLIQATL